MKLDVASRQEVIDAARSITEQRRAMDIERAKERITALELDVHRMKGILEAMRAALEGHCFRP